ncbi:MAG: ferredoxin [Saprospiraceae bacterium]|nr:ferredoxin [Saprospiraceae bacterium]
MTETDKSNMNDTSEVANNKKELPVLDHSSSWTSEEYKVYRRYLQKFFLTGKKKRSPSQKMGMPVLFDHFLRNDSLSITYPLIWDYDTSKLRKFQAEVDEVLKDHFNSDQVELLMNHLSPIILNLQDKAYTEGKTYNYELLIQVTVDAIKEKESEFQDKETFNDQCQRVLQQLMGKSAVVIDLSDSTAFKILNLQLGRRKVRNQAFQLLLKKSLSEVNEILLLNGSEPESIKQSFGFADDLVSMDRIKDMTPSLEMSSLPEERLSRLRKYHEVLTEAKSKYSANSGIIFVSEKINKEYLLDDVITSADVTTCFDSPCSKANEFFKKEMDFFIDVICAIRIIELEVNQQYDEELHDSYFNGFSRSHLSDEDLIYFRPIIIVEEGGELMEQSKDLLALLSQDSLVKIFSITKTNDILNPKGDISDDTHLDIASLVIFRRDVNFFQSGLDTPFAFNDAIDDEIDTPFPTFWNLLLPSSESYGVKHNTLLVKAAIESRAFPRIKYEVNRGNHIGDRLDISKNAQIELDFPSYRLDVQSTNGADSHDFNLTPCDVFVMNGEAEDFVEVLPFNSKDDTLIPISEYLEGDPGSSKGKIPIVWLVDKDLSLKKAVVPVSVIQRIRGRLDFWSFIKDLDGGFSERVDQDMDEFKSKVVQEKESELISLREELEAKYDSMRSADLEQSLTRILYRLIDSDQDISQVLNSITNSAEPPKEMESHSPDLTTEAEEIPEIKQDKVVQAEAWIETDECTSCNDCIDALPAVFKYNDDKQAVVHNPTGGTYAKIVAAAEKCPAACIHPGLPNDKSEPNLDKLMKRAEKFN